MFSFSRLKLLPVFFFFLINSFTLYGWDFSNNDFNLKISLPKDWSRSEDMEKQISSCILSVLNDLNTESFNTVVINSHLDENFETLSSKEIKTEMENLLGLSTQKVESMFNIAVGKSYLKVISSRYFIIHEYRLDGFYIIQAETFYKYFQYTFTLTSVSKKNKKKFFDVLETLKFGE